MKQCMRVQIGGAMGFVTVDVRKPAKCSICMERPHTRECDGPAPRGRTGTCDAKLCDSCRIVLPRPGGEDLDLCPRCCPPPRVEETAPRRGLYHLQLPQPWPWALTVAGAPCMFPRQEGEKGPRCVPAPPTHFGVWLALWAPPDVYDETAWTWMRETLRLPVPRLVDLPTGAYVALAELGGCTSVCNDGRAFREPWWGGTGRTFGTYAWWVEACGIQPLPSPAHGLGGAYGFLEPLPERLVSTLRTRYDATVGGRWWPHWGSPRAEPSPMVHGEPVPPTSPRPKQEHLL